MIVVAWFAGWFSGTSRDSMSATFVPLLFGLISLFVLRTSLRPVWSLVLVVAFLAFFMNGLDLGENVQSDFSIQKLLRDSRLQVRNDVYDEMVLLDAGIRSAGLGIESRNDILYGFALRIAMDTGLTDDEKAGSLRKFRDSLRAVTH